LGVVDGRLEPEDEESENGLVVEVTADVAVGVGHTGDAT
jgi:hypothetical protein